MAERRKRMTAAEREQWRENRRKELLTRLATDIRRTDEGGAGVREPRRPNPTPLPIDAAVVGDE